jgi:hypothetical protein
MLSASNANAAEFAGIQANESYLLDTKYSSPGSDIVILDKNRQLQLSQQYADANRYYEMRSNYGIMGINDQIAYINAMTSFSSNVFSEIKSYQMTTQRNAVLGKLKDNPTVLKIEDVTKVPAVLVGGAYSIYKGASVPFDIASGTKVIVGGSVEGRNASLAVSSFLVNASFSANQQAFTTSFSKTLLGHIGLSLSGSFPMQDRGVPTSIVGASYGIGI